MAPFPELLKVMRLALMPPAKVKHRKPHQATIFVRLLYLRRVLLSSHWLLLFRVCRSFCGSRNQISGIDNSVGCVWIYWSAAFLSAAVSVHVLDPNLQPVAPPLIRFKMAYLGSSEITSVVCLPLLALIFQVM